MRGLGLLAIVAAGCGFHVAASGEDQPIDAAINGSADALDAYVAPPACMMNPAYSNGPGGHRYRKTAGSHYDGAIVECAADGAHLAVIDSMAENMFVPGFANGDVWIGYDDLTTEGSFRWFTGAPTTFNGFTGSEPNDSGVEDCTYIRSSDGTWNDTNCGDSRAALCECEIGYTPPPTPTCRSMPNYVEHDGRRYFIHDTPLTWPAAKAECESTGAHLVVFSDQDENDAVDAEFLADSWIGLSDTATEGTFVWVNGSTDAYRRWGSSSPHAGNTSRNCVEVNITWQDIDCTSNMNPYACECDPAPP